MLLDRVEGNAGHAVLAAVRHTTLLLVRRWNVAKASPIMPRHCKLHWHGAPQPVAPHLLQRLAAAVALRGQEAHKVEAVGGQAAGSQCSDGCTRPGHRHDLLRAKGSKETISSMLRIRQQQAAHSSTCVGVNGITSSKVSGVQLSAYRQLPSDSKLVQCVAANHAVVCCTHI